MKHSDYVKKVENEPEYLLGKINMLEKENACLRGALEEVRIIVNNYIYKRRTAIDYIKALNWDRKHGE